MVPYTFETQAHTPRQARHDVFFKLISKLQSNEVDHGASYGGWLSPVVHSVCEANAADHIRPSTSTVKT